MRVCVMHVVVRMCFCSHLSKFLIASLLHAYVHNHVDVCAPSYVYFYMCECMHVWCVCVYYVCVYVWMYVHMFLYYVCVCIYVYIYELYVCVCMCVYMCMWVWIYRYTQNFLLDLMYSIFWLFILLCFTIILFIDAEQQLEISIYNWHKKTFCPSVRTHLFLCIFAHI